MIQLKYPRTTWDCCQRYYRQAIFNTLMQLKPKYSLEIGSYLFQSSSVWSHYYDTYMSDGHLITCDIAKWSNSEPPKHVSQVMVLPHIKDVENNHGGIDVFYKDYNDYVDDSVINNVDLIREKMYELKIPAFDLTFVDGDHARDSFLKDLDIAKFLTWGDGYILIDDINDRNHAQYEVYRELKAAGNEFYEFDEWTINPGMALIQNKDLKL